MVRHRMENFTHIYPHPKVVGLCGGDGRIEKLEFTLHEDQKTYDSERIHDYHGWIDFERDNELCMVWPSRMQVDMCFAYGPKVEEKRGRGKVVRLNIKSLGMAE